MKNKNLIVGLFVLAGLVLFMAGLVLIGNRHEAFARHMDYYADFTNLAGLSKGAKVQVAGMDAGQVLDIAVPASPTARFRVKLRIEESLHGLVRTDSVATIGTQGVVGETFLLIHPGSPNAPAASALSLLPSKEPMDLANLLDQGQGLVSDVDGAVKDADGILKKTGGQLGPTLDSAKTTLANVNDVVVGLKQGRGAAGMLLQDPALATQIRQTMTNVQQASADLGQLSGKAKELVTDVQSRHFPQKIDETMTVVKSAASNVDATTQQIRQTIAEASIPDENGATPGMNIRESLSNANTATANVADGTEALKHNFLLRSFFRHRGYYDLGQLSADKYRQDHLFTSPENYRVWLPGTELFQQNTNGSEELSVHGKALLANALARYGESVVGSPIVIEGYSDVDGPANQLALSRNRAVVVRQYLLNHFQLNPGNLGAVPLMNLPPSGFGHQEWDGICIVVLKAKR
jgi:phospholipid/cholesterol/gamma-HCH transport system substrate-binding protein